MIGVGAEYTSLSTWRGLRSAKRKRRRAQREALSAHGAVALVARGWARGWMVENGTRSGREGCDGASERLRGPRGCWGGRGVRVRERVGGSVV